MLPRAVDAHSPACDGSGRRVRQRRRIETEDDVDDVIALLRLSYDRVVARHGLELRLGDSAVMLADEFPELGVLRWTRRGQLVTERTRA